MLRAPEPALVAPSRTRRLVEEADDGCDAAVLARGRDVEADRERLPAASGHELPLEAHDGAVGVDAPGDGAEDVAGNLRLDGSDEPRDRAVPATSASGSV
jgi:hypothetical protein